MKVLNGWTSFAYQCPNCKNDLSFFNNDNLEAFKTDFDAFRKNLSIYAVLGFLQCKNCKETFFTVELSVIQNTALSLDWQSQYFWMNKESDEEEIFITLERENCLDGFPTSCPASVTELKEGRLIRFYLGPLSREELGQDYETFFKWCAVILSFFTAENLALCPLTESATNPR